MREWVYRHEIFGTGGGTFVTQWGYDSADRPVWMKYPGGSAGQIGEQVNYAYTTQGLLDTVRSNGSTYYVGKTQYNVRGQVTERWLGSTTGVVKQLYAYSAAENFRLVSSKAGNAAPHTNLQNITYTYDDAGNVLTISDAAAFDGAPPPATQVQSFNYDGLNRLLRGFTGNLTCQTYDNTTGNGVFDESNAFNNAGNLVSKTGLGAYSYGAQAASCAQGALSKPHAVVAAGGNTYCYDQTGNMVRRTIGGVMYTLTYDAENRLTGISGAATASFSYDADGNRVKSVLKGETVIYVGSLYEKKVVGSTTTHTKYYTFGGRRIAVRVAGTLSWLLSDHLGSTTVTADGVTGGRTAELWYKPWGESRGTPFGTTPTQRRFTGQVLDGVAGGLYFYNARYYDPALGRFVSADTLIPDPGNPQNLNRYAYVGNNALRFIDPSGFDPIDAAWEQAFNAAHGRAPTDQDRRDRFFSILFAGSGANGNTFQIRFE